ncbi:3-deoxy-D-manno-octulosonic acid transferase [Marinomonas algarum]|uniref:3-deoxy-D-manno-octulosonic acid transferase n=1 Tax=Marinomonas algarum TaxID=2883105 RepID=A0A9X1LEX0_9GAMM|nr:3-deoxy-D-manno-octulosonic acid transferase [Marinomonas algarum]MCB5161935.1 3-deoxy-D-manno-octulosonic acid transferase [Marinomonas algarum]
MWLYRALFMIFTPFVLTKVRRFQKNNSAYRAKEAMGYWPKVSADLWVHCASVGEVLAVRPLVEQWRRQHPSKRLLITTMTPTGAEQVTKSFPFAEHRYLPMDWRCAVKRVITQLDCRHLVIVETELWPNLLHLAKAHGFQVDVVNARLSERSFQRYQKFSLISRPLFALPDSFLAHAQADAERFTALGARKVSVVGNIKFDLTVPDTVVEDNWRRRLGERFVWVGASTHPGEDEILLNAHQALIKVLPNALLILVPRHPERFDDVYRLAKQGVNTAMRRSQSSLDDWSHTNVVVGDSMGELMHYYQASDIAFVGGSLIERGGHNPIEPALLAKAILVGEHTFNFFDITQQLIDAGGAIRCHNESELVQRLIELAADQPQRQAIGQNALQFAEKNQGAVARVLSEIDFH